MVVVVFVPVKSTTVDSSITAGKRHPETPPKVSDAQ
jgi:hypothetical protein